MSEQEPVHHDVSERTPGPCLSGPLNQPHGMTPEEATSLFHLRCIWGDRYSVSFSGGEWKAHRVGSGAPWDIKARTAGTLKNQIGEDYRQWQAEARRAR